jgi:hypothetical protein
MMTPKEKRDFEKLCRGIDISTIRQSVAHASDWQLVQWHAAFVMFVEPAYASGKEPHK